MTKMRELEAASSPVWETLESFVREQVQQFIQRLLEEEVTELLGRRKSARREPGAERASGMVSRVGWR
jgi:transposase-like protein